VKVQKVLLIRTAKKEEGVSPPLGLLYIASSIKRFLENIKVEIIDLGVEELSMEEIKKKIENFDPDVLGLSTMTVEADIMQKVARIAKNVKKDMIVLVGGPHATLCYESVLKNKDIDYAIVGEGEITIISLLKSLNKNGDVSGVEGVAYRKSNKIIKTRPRASIKNLDEIPFPAWDLINMKKYSDYPTWNGIIKKKYYMSVITSRGCPYGCIYCHNIFGKQYRSRSPKNVFSEIKTLCNNYGVKEIHIIDDAFNLDLERAKKICNLIINSKMDIAISFPNGMRGDIVDEELLDKLKRAGTYKINYGIETVSTRLQKMTNHNLNIKKIREVIRMTNEKGIITLGLFMLGFPTESKEEMLKTIEFAANSELYLAKFFRVVPYPGTKLYNSKFNKKEHFYGDYSDYHFYSNKLNCSNIPLDELNNIARYAMWRFYRKPKRIFKLFLKYPKKVSLLRKLFIMYLYSIS